MDAEKRRGPHQRPPGLLQLVAALVVLMSVLPTTVLAQGSSESPAPSMVAPEAPASAIPATDASEAPDGPDAGPVFPSTLAGADLEVRTYSGAGWLAEFEDGTAESATYAEDTMALLGSLGKDMDDLTVRSALAQPSEGNQAVIVAMQVTGVEARDFAVEAVRLLLGDVEEPELVLRPLGGRWVLRVVDAAIPGVYPRTVYLDGDTAWIIGADEPSVLELLEQLPAPSFHASAADQPMSAQLPVVLDGRRRAGLYETIEPQAFLPALFERVGPAFDDWMLDLYLTEGMMPTDLVGAVAWWGLESSDQSVEIEGYQVPGAPAELVERFRSEVFLAAGQALPQEVSRTDQELGGRQVTTIDLGSSRRHVFATGDTVWVVTDHADEPALAEEAIAALP